MALTDSLRSLLDSAENLLTQREPARAIGYGAALVLVGVSVASNALGFTRIPNIDLPTALGLATAGIGTVVAAVEGIRKFVFAPATVDAIVADGDTT